ncbi:MAG: chemotaxis response regulator protein-glutamate methylesterase [Candidatus Pristimantibacillus sp.]
MAPYRILVVDDSPFMRKIFSDLILQDSQFMIVATASNGVEAIEAISKWKPDAVTLDLEMPEMNGIDALQHIMKHDPTPIIMLSGISEENTRETIKALQYGAFDFIRKPSSAVSNDITQVGELLIEKLKIAVLMKRYAPAIEIDESIKSLPASPTQLEKSKNLNRQQGDSLPKKNAPETVGSDNLEIRKQLERLPKRKTSTPLHTNRTPVTPLSENIVKKEEKKEKALTGNKDFRHIIAIGTSTGGPRALHEVISSLPAGLPAPVMVVQHMPPKFTKSLAQRLDNFSPLKVVEATQGERLYAGVVYIAPGGYHMEIAKDNQGFHIQLTQQPPRNGHRPSVDVLFESLTPFKELKRHAVIMTGMGSDGAKGMKALVESGVESTIAESEETCIVYGMPRSAVENGSVTTVLPLQRIASQLQYVVSQI